MQYTSKEVYEYISQQTKDPIVEWKTCEVSRAQFPIYQSDLEFYDRISPVINWVKYPIPTPKLCPEERERQRLMFRNERHLYRNKCRATGKDIISIHSQDKPYPVFSKEYRRSDARNPLDYGLPFNSQLSFFEQFRNLHYRVPKLALSLMKNENVDYGNDIEQAKNCYMTFNSCDIEEVYYSSAVREQAKWVIDSYWVGWSEIIYEGVGLTKCYKVFYSSYCDNCSDCKYCTHCEGCQHCYDCHGLKNKQYCVGNKQYSKEKYEEIIKNHQKDPRKFPINNLKNKQTENCFGNNLMECKNCTFTFSSHACDQLKYANIGLLADHSYDITNCGTDYSYNYQEIGSYFNQHCAFNVGINTCKNCRYSIDCFNCSDCFGCTGLRNKSYCILNQQYEKEDYFKLIEHIIQKMKADWEWGKFFPPKISLFGYNESQAHEKYPLSSQEAKQQGWNRQEYNYDPVVSPHAETIVRERYSEQEWKQLLWDPQITNKVFICEISKRPFRCIRQEIDFYKKHNIPLPSKHPDIRYTERLQKKVKEYLNFWNCDACGKRILTAHSHEKEYPVYCESCYQKEIG